MTSPNTIIADMQAEIDALRKERDKLIAICEKVVNYGIGASDVKAMREAIAKAKEFQL